MEITLYLRFMKARNFVLLTFLLFLGHMQAKANLSKNWISYFGYGNTRIYSIEYDAVSNHIYMVGTTSEKDLGTPGVHQPSFNDSSNDPLDQLDVFIAKFSTSGVLVWFTYYGGSKRESNPSLALDKLGNIYISGYTQSPSGIVSPGAHQTGLTEGADFLAKFDAQGQRLWATYYNEHSSITPFGPQVAVDQNNNVCMFGRTSNINGIATSGTHQPVFYDPTNGGSINAYLVKFSPGGQRVWGTYFGGGREVWNKDIRTDQQNNIYIAGYTGSTSNVASPGAMVTQVQLTTESASYLAKFNASGQRVWSTYIHNQEGDMIHSVAADIAGNVYVFGMAASDSGISTPGAWQLNKAAAGDFFLMKLNSSGHKVWGTYYGGDAHETDVITTNGGFDVNLSRNRIRLSNGLNPDIYVSGSSSGITGIQKGCTIPVDTSWGGVLSRFSNNGQLIWGSKYDGIIFDFDRGINDSLYFVGNTARNNLASANAFQPNKPPQLETGLFGKFVEHYVCPTDVTIPFSRVNDSLIAPTGHLNYQWSRNDTLLQNGPQNYFILQDYYQGVYKLKVLDPCNCIFNSDTLFVEHTTGIKNGSGNTLALNIVPNPATNMLNIQLSNAGQSPFRFRIYNILGRKVLDADAKFDADNKKVIDISNYTPGLYILSVENREGKTTVKFIRQ